MGMTGGGSFQPGFHVRAPVFFPAPGSFGDKRPGFGHI